MAPPPSFAGQDSTSPARRLSPRWEPRPPPRPRGLLGAESGRRALTSRAAPARRARPREPAPARLPRRIGARPLCTCRWRKWGLLPFLPPSERRETRRSWRSPRRIHRPSRRGRNHNLNIWSFGQQALHQLSSSMEERRQHHSLN
uniref:Suprabasin n=1 Tax=Pipistrellus kuhlii TaxID=59472 RepID=A0A7J7V127_PIPKU|nr:suprabasin [Pipistrellus kuhlii]